MWGVAQNASGAKRERGVSRPASGRVKIAVDVGVQISLLGKMKLAKCALITGKACDQRLSRAGAD